MVSIAGYQILQKIFDGSNASVYRAIQVDTNTPVIIKLLKADNPSLKQIAKLKHEYEVAGGIKLDGVVKPYALEHCEHSFALISDDFGGVSLRDLMAGKKLELATFFAIAIQLCQIVGQIHQRGIIHKDIKPQNIIVHPQTLQVKITGFGIASLLPQESRKIGYPALLEGTLAYMSPEQTGRMNRCLDYRTDFYSLGVTFYEMLTGVLPFASNDPLELVHCHLTRKPVDLCQRADIPAMLSNITLKLLAKTSEERYQSAFGLKADIEECLRQWQASGRIAAFTLGQNDVSEKFQISPKLYGRENEIEAVWAAFQRTIHGHKEAVLVAGCAGVGKSSLIQEIQKMITRQKGYFVAGKFEHLKRSIPYSALFQAFTELIRQLLTEPENKILLWKEKLLQALGSNGQVLIDVIPEVELVIGPQHPVADLGPGESQNRFLLVLRDFVSLFAQMDHPLVMFLDDLQWVDSASLNLVKLILSDAEASNLFFIGAYRDNEIDAVHPLSMALEEFAKEGIRVTSICLHPLNIEQIAVLLAETLHCAPERTMPLAGIICQRTQGNAFFVKEFLHTLYQQGFLQFDVECGKWTWDIEKIHDMEITDNVVELMASKLQRLNETTQNVLKLAACIGNQFELKILSIVYEKSPAATFFDFWEALREGFLLPLAEAQKFFHNEFWANADWLQQNIDEQPLGYKFSHDRVRQAAYSLMSEQQRKQVHYKIGKLLLQNATPKETEERLFDIVFHLDFASALVSECKDRETLSHLNWQAGKKAKSSTAYASAARYLEMGIQFLPTTRWETHYDVVFSLHMELAQCEYLQGNFEKAEHLFEILLRQAQSKIDRAKVYDTQIVLYTNMGKYAEAIATGIAALDSFAMKVCKHPGMWTLVCEIQKVRRRLGRRSAAELLHLPVMTEAEKLATVNLLRDLIPPAYFTNKNLFALIIMKIVAASLQWGNSTDSIIGYAGYGVILSSQGYAQQGYEFGKLAIALSEKFSNMDHLGQSYYIFASLISIWRDNVRMSVPLAEKAYKILLESGNLIHAGYAISAHLFYLCIGGYPLNEIGEKVQKYLGFLTKIKDHDRADYFIVVRQKIQAWEKDSEDPTSFSHDGYDELQHAAAMQGKKDLSPLQWYYLNKMETLVMFEKYPQALAIAEKSKELVDQGVFLGLLQVPQHYFYHSLILAALYAQAPLPQKVEYLAVVARNQKKMRAWARHCRQNFLHKYLLVEAEMERARQRGKTAGALYDQAIHLAAENGYTNDLALSHELAARFYFAQRLDVMAAAHLQQSCYFYLQWGAKAKVKSLQHKYPHLFQTAAKNAAAVDGSDTLITTSRENVALDLHTVLKASQAISQEIVLDKLLTRLISIMMENAGAQRGVLLLIRENKVVVEAEKIVDKDTATIVRSSACEQKVSLPQSIINYVKRTGESIVLPNAGKDNLFANDPYVSENKAKSVLCSAIFKQAQPMGILYLENNLTTNAFTPQRLQILETLSSQAAISLENAWLYEEMKQAREAVKKREEHFRSLIENALDIITILDADGSIRYTSPSVAKVLGYLSAEIEGKDSLGLVNPEDIDKVSNAYQKLLLDPFQPHSIEIRCRHKNGDWRLLECIGQTMAGEVSHARIIVNARDVTERKQAEYALRESEDRYRNLIESSPDTILVEQAGAIVYINPAGLKLLGYVDVAELANRGLQQICVTQEGPESGWKRSPHALMEGKFYHKNNSMVDVEMIGMETTYHGKPALEVIARDITETKALRKKTQKMQQLASLGQLSATIAHEIRNPLSSISLNFQYLSEHLGIPPNYQNTFHNIGHGILRIQKVVEGILNFARPLQSNLKKVNLHKIIDSSLRYVDRELEEKQIKVVKEYCPRPLDVSVDSGQITEVFVNLFTNARQAMPKGGQLQLTTRAANDTVEVFITDTGEGISAQNMEKLFTPFFTTRRDGTGLGLAIVSKILEEHQATIKVESKPGVGTTFAITFPWKG